MRLRRPGRPALPSRRSIAGLVAAVLAAAGALVAVPLPASAVPRPFTPAFTATTTGDIVTRGNTLLTCPAGSTGLPGGYPCEAVQAGSAGNNDNFDMTYVDVDDDSDTFNSSRASVTIPPGAVVLFAGLAWGASTATETGAAPGDAGIGEVKFGLPGEDYYVPVTATAVDTIDAGYQGFADVTATVAEAGSGVYTVADVQAAEGAGGYAGWSLTVVYQDRAQPFRNLVVLTGLQRGTQLSGVRATASGFTTPATGAVAARVGVVAYEGDLERTGERVTLAGKPLRNTLNPDYDIFNSTMTDLGVPVTGGSPTYTHQLGYDIDRFDATGHLANNATSATIALSSSHDVYLAGVITLATDLTPTFLSATKSVVDVNGGDVRPGDEMRYSIVVRSTHFDEAHALRMTDVVSPYASYVDDSLRIDGVPVTADGGDDTGSVVNGEVSANLGVGATPYDGGWLGSADVATVSFSVRVRTDAGEGTKVTNTAQTSYQDAEGRSVSRASNEVTSTVRATALVTTTQVPAGQLSVPYSSQLVGEFGRALNPWALAAGTLPPGISLDPATGLLSGTPTELGTYAFTVSLTDEYLRTDTQELTITALPGVSLSADRTSVRFDEKVTLTTTVAPSEATGTVTFSVPSADSSSGGGSVDLGTFPVVAGTASAAVAMPRLGLNKVTATYNGDSGYPASTSAPVDVEAKAYQGQVLVSEFRTSGPSGIEDSYVELTNMGPDVPLAGFTVETDSGTAGVVPPGAGVLGTGRSYLLAGWQYSLGALAQPDGFLGAVGEAGIRVVAPDTATTVTDAVGTGPGFHRGTPLPSLGGEPARQYAWWRTQANGLPVDTGNNDADFALVATEHELINGVKVTIGSPSPTGTTSPHRHNAALTSTLLDPRVGQSMGVNRQYVPGTPSTPSTPPTPGMLTVRRTITNTSEVTVTQAHVRITALSAHAGEPRPGTLVQPTSQAILRVFTPTTPVTFVPLPNGEQTTVVNLAPDAPSSGFGGGLNTTMTVPLPNGGLAPNQSVHVAFTFAVDKPGSYWFGYDVDALSSTAAS